MGGLKTETGNLGGGLKLKLAIWGGSKTETGNSETGNNILGRGLKTETDNSETGNNILGGSKNRNWQFGGGGGLKTETGNFLLHFQNSKSSNRCRSVYGTDIKNTFRKTKTVIYLTQVHWDCTNLWQFIFTNNIVL